MALFTFSDFQLSRLALFGLILLLGLLGGELARWTKFIPPITGYIAVGVLAGPSGLDLISPSLLAESRIFVDISIGLVLFVLGRQLDFRWLRYDKSLLWMSIAESLLTFFVVLLVLHACNISWLSSALAAAIAVTTSSAVIMIVAHDLSSQGPVTRRTLMLTCLNNVYGVVAFIILLPLSTKEPTSFRFMAEYYSYQLLGSTLIGLIMFSLTLVSAKIVGKNKETQFVMFIGAIILTIGLARTLNISMMLALLTFGIATRNLDWKHYILEINFEWFARLPFILLFVITGFQLQLKGLQTAALAALAFIFARTIAKSAGIFLFANKSRLTHNQSASICLALTPMAGIALGLSNKIIDFNTELGYQIALIISTVVAVLQLLGPIATQYAFITANETLWSKNKN